MWMIYYIIKLISSLMIKPILSQSFVFYFIFSLLFVRLIILLSTYQRWNGSHPIGKPLDQDKSFECGFDRFNKVYEGFCVQYIKTAFLFLMVDLEIALLVPIIINTPIYERVYLSRILTIVIVSTTLILILFLEFQYGGLNWEEEL